jgi:plasmid stability protein
MSQLVILDIEEATLEELRQRAAVHGRTAEVEAKQIIQEALQLWRAAQWSQVNAIREDLAATGQVFTDSTVLIREDRDR